MSSLLFVFRLLGIPGVGIVNSFLALMSSEEDSFDSLYQEIIASTGAIIGCAIASVITLNSGGGLAIIFLAPFGLFIGSIIGAIAGFFTLIFWGIFLDFRFYLVTIAVLIGVAVLGYMSWGIGVG